MENNDVKFEEIKEENEKCLNLFREYLENLNLKEKTIDRHVSVADHYLNKYLINSDLSSMKDGLTSKALANYFDDLFICQFLWSSPTAMKRDVDSIKMFYKCMTDNGLTSQKEYTKFLKILEEDLPYWIKDFEYYLSSRSDFDD